MATEKDSFILYTEQKEIIDNLSDEQAGQLFKAIFNYAKTGEENNLSGIVKIAYIPIKQSIDRNQEKWEEIKHKRSEAGKRGMANRWKKEESNSITNDNNVITNDNKNNNVKNDITRNNKNNC